LIRLYILQKLIITAPFHYILLGYGEFNSVMKNFGCSLQNIAKYRLITNSFICLIISSPYSEANTLEVQCLANLIPACYLGTHRGRTLYEVHCIVSTITCFSICFQVKRPRTVRLIGTLYNSLYNTFKGMVWELQHLAKLPRGKQPGGMELILIKLNRKMDLMAETQQLNRIQMARTAVPLGTMLQAEREAKLSRT